MATKSSFFSPPQYNSSKYLNVFSPSSRKLETQDINSKEIKSQMSQFEFLLHFLSNLNFIQREREKVRNVLK